MQHDHLTERQFRLLAELIQGQVGIKLPPAKRIMVESRLRRRIRALGIPDLATYGREVIEGDRLNEEFVHLVDCVTTNKTDFFREPAHFDLLRTAIVPDMRRLSRSASPLRVWSAACSIGAEPYTIAMVLSDMARSEAFDFTVMATDISTEALAQARRAVYSAEMARQIPPDVRRRYVMEARDPDKPRVRIVPELRGRVQFSRMNLMDASYPVPRDMDVIFCRNVLIYFDQQTQQKVIARLAAHLRPGGYLLVGHSESMALDDRSGMTQVKPTVYRSTSSRAAAA